jgi:lipopolysaccharide transport system permease protein
MRTWISGLWAYRGFITGSVKREFQAKYQNSILGAAWNVINPLSMILVYTLIFSKVMKSRMPGESSEFSFSIYLCAGLLTWGLFVEITSRAQTVFLENANLLKKVSFPRLCLPTIVVLNALLNFAIVFTLFLIFLLLTGNFPGLVILGIIPLLVIQITFSIGLGITLGILNVFFRDVGQFYNVFLQFWFWLTPIVYVASILPEGMVQLLTWNPMVPLISGYQRIFLKHLWPDWGALTYVSSLSVAICLIAGWLFHRNSGELVDEL